MAEQKISICNLSEVFGMVEEQGQAASSGCGCKADTFTKERRDEGGRLIAIESGTDLHFCPLHAAAPEMYEVLKMLLKHYLQLADSGDCGLWDSSEEQEVIEVKALIAKIDGRES